MSNLWDLDHIQPAGTDVLAGDTIAAPGRAGGDGDEGQACTEPRPTLDHSLESYSCPRSAIGALPDVADV